MTTARSIDRIFLQAWVPKLQSVAQVCNFLVHQRGYRIPSSAAFGQIGDAYVARCTSGPRPRVWRSWKAKGHEHAAHPHMEWGRQMAYVNHFYFYLWDPDWDRRFGRPTPYAPYPVWLWLNGHEWANRTL